VRKPPEAQRNKRPTPATAPAGSALDEVERALSVLDGRHPDFVRAQRETREAALVREKALRAERRRAWQKRAKVAFLTLTALCGIAAAAWFGWQTFARARALSAALDAQSAVFAADGFAILGSSNLITPHEVAVQASGPACFIALTAAPAGEMVVSHGGSVVRHSRSIGWCSCEAERVVVDAPPGASSEQGVRILGGDARALGGPQGWALAPARPQLVASGGEECQETVLVSWIADRRFPREAVDGAWLEHGPGAHLSEAGFKTVSGSLVGRTFAVVEAAPGSCMLALRPDKRATPESLLLEDMTGKVIARGPSLLWCDLHGRPLTVRGSGAAAVLVVAAPASRIGGLLGAREWAARAGQPDPTTWVNDEDLTLDAVATLRASALPDVTEGPPRPGARFVALSLRATGTLARDVSPSAAAPECSPSLDSGRLESICAQAGAQQWLAAAGETLGLAGAPTPFWLDALEDRVDQGALQAELKLLALARRLTSEGFEVTMFSGVTELTAGRIVVLGRARDDAVVAIEIATVAPWVMPYSDAAPWTLDGDPREVPLAPGGRVTLTASPHPEVEAKQRRTIVFRRPHAP
jgi:hypothetical protein